MMGAYTENALISSRKTVDSQKSEKIDRRGFVAIATQEMPIDCYNRYSCPLYNVSSYNGSSSGSEDPQRRGELELLNPDMETLQQHHDYLVALWESGVIYIREIADYQIAMRRESCGRVLPLERSPFCKEARDKAQQRVDQSPPI
jgi:hypothetical protein